MESTNPVDPSLAVATNGLRADPIYVGDDLHIDLWVRPMMGHPKSILIRSVDENGQMRSSLLHIADDVRIIPNYTNGVALAADETLAATTVKPKAKRKVFRRIVEVAFGLVIFALLSAFITGALQGRVVLTGSMKPTINPGDVVITKSIKFAHPKVGDIVLYSARDLQGQAVSTWAHRIIGGNAKDGFVIKGDANPAPDIGNPKLSDIQSVVIFKIPSIGHYMNPLVVILLGSGLMMLLFAISMFKRPDDA
jgi:signal peptidase I